MKNQKTILAVWTILMAAGALGVYLYVKISSTPVFSVVSSKKKPDGSAEEVLRQSWFERITGKDTSDLYPATETAFSLDMGDFVDEDKEFYYILSISKLSEEKFRIVEKRLSELKVLYSAKQESTGYSVNVSLKDKLTAQKLAAELKESLK